MKTREAPFAVRTVRRVRGDAAIVYRRMLDAKHRERLKRIATISPLATTAGMPLLKAALAACGHPKRPKTGLFYGLDADWGTRLAGYALVTSGLRSAQAMARACDHFLRADAVEAGWWLGLMMQHERGRRARRALRILLDVVK